MLLLEEGKDYDNVDNKTLPYKHIRNLGHGHSGVVEEVVDEVTKNVYARKTIWLPASRASKVEQTKVFHNEIKIIRGLGNHRHIIKIFTTYMTRRHVGLILQPVASEGDLEEFLAEYWSDVRHMEETNEPNPRLDAMVPVMERAFGCLAVGLAFIHEKKVRHKDVKPKNILVHNGLVIYTDFGYSLDSSAFSRSTTEGRPNALTRKYSAPEVIDHDERNSKSDVYSLGCVFIDLLSALTLAMGPDEIKCYSESMQDLHSQLVSWEVSPRLSSLPSIITGMTARDASRRLGALHAVTEILQLHNFCCPECGSMVIQDRNEGVQDGKCLERSEKMMSAQDQPEKEGSMEHKRAKAVTMLTKTEPPSKNSINKKTEYQSEENVLDAPNLIASEDLEVEENLAKDQLANTFGVSTGDHVEHLAGSSMGDHSEILYDDGDPAGRVGTTPDRVVGRHSVQQSLLKDSTFAKIPRRPKSYEKNTVESAQTNLKAPGEKVETAGYTISSNPHQQVPEVEEVGEDNMYNGLDPNSCANSDYLWATVDADGNTSYIWAEA